MRSLPYPKIETLFNRDKSTFKVQTNEFRRPEFAIINPWILTEKIDGTNIRLHFWQDDDSSPEYEIVGRTDKAQLPKPLFNKLQMLCVAIQHNVTGLLYEHDLESLTIYGEGYGAGIQKGGGNYRPDPGFIAFDMLVDGKTWLSYDQARGNADELGLDFVPSKGRGSVQLAVNMVGRDFLDSWFGEFEAEGIVARPAVELRNQRGQRVIWKLKGSDF